MGRRAVREKEGEKVLEGEGERERWKRERTGEIINFEVVIITYSVWVLRSEYRN